MHMTARFASTCATTGQPIAKGDTIDWNKATKTATLVAKAEPGAQAAPATHGRYLRQARHGSNYTRFTSGAEHFQNKAGRCIDAPCCGCCG